METLLRDAGLSEVHGVNYIGVAHHYIMTGAPASNLRHERSLFIGGV